MLKIGIICPSEIAFRRFMPALTKFKDIEYKGVAIATKEEWFNGKNIQEEEYKKIINTERKKAENFQTLYGGKIYNSYKQMLESGEINAVYIPLPPALHYKWAKYAMGNNLHVFIEKPSSISLEQTKDMVEIANAKHLALHENYMFIYHSQIEKINEIIRSGEIGEIRLIRIDFGFPNRGKNDFRYIKSLGGGALLDCGGYTFKYANYLLGGDSSLACANVGYKEGYEVEIYGSATLKNKRGETVQTSFGMDNDYRCSIDIWGSEGTLKSNRVLTAPEGYEPNYEISKNGITNKYKMDSDDAFYKSILRFKNCIENEQERIKNYNEILKQEKLVEDFAILSGLRG